MDARLQDFDRRMIGANELLAREFAGIRAGRASANLLDPIKVDAYGNFLPINQVSTINAPEPRMLTVMVWDKGMVKMVEKAIRDSSLGLNPSVDGQTIRILLPDLNEQRRQELAKVAAKYTEDCKISIRNVRRDGMEYLKKLEKDKQISEDEHHRLSQEIQNLTDKYIKKTDEMLAHKQKEIMHV